jgi:hypothetical protein
LWANFRALIGIFSQSVGPSLAIWANPLQFSLVTLRAIHGKLPAVGPPRPTAGCHPGGGGARGGIRPRLRGADDAARGGAPERKSHRVGPEFSSWPSSLTENPYKSLNVGPQFGSTLYNFRSGQRLRRAAFDENPYRLASIRKRFGDSRM